MNSRDPLHARPSGNVRQSRHSALVAVLVASVALGGIIAFAQDGDKKSLATADTAAAGTSGTVAAAQVAASGSVAGVVPANSAVGIDNGASTESTVAAAIAGTADTATADASAAPSVDLDEPTAASGTDCKLTEQSVREGSTGASVTCLQNALIAAGFYSGPASGTFDPATTAAVRKLQTDRNLFVDGIAGRESAISLGIWPDEQSLVVHTPKPAPGTKDELGFPLSTVSSIGNAIPPKPADPGSGKRLVYDRAQQRVWAVAADGHLIRSWLVSGSQYNNEVPGIDHVYSKSETSSAWNCKAILPHMV
ncbi:MAG: hypothetical protein JWN39_2160, partial [Ilumatobacteraceae bacterium]|nr:hypothetical protein [Ilumatobacteraceae bacterium]